MNQLIYIALGGSVGALARFFVANGIYAWLGRNFPYGTLFINVSGSFLMGFLSAMLMQRYALVQEYRAALLIGFLGAYTTFSTYALESLYLIEEGNLLKAALNILLSNVLSLAAVWIGLLIGRKLFNSDAEPWLEQLPYLQISLGMLLAFLLIALTQLLLLNFHLPQTLQLIVLILLLALLTVVLTLWISFKLYHFQLDIQPLLSIFISANLCSMVVIWLGTLLGNWLWRLNLLQ